MLLRAEWPSQEHRRIMPPFPYSGFTGLPPAFFSVHIKSIPLGTEIFRFSMQEREVLTGTEQKRHNKQKVHPQGINRPRTAQ